MSSVPDNVAPKSCNGVAMNGPKAIAPVPANLMTWEAPFNGIFLEKRMKNMATLKHKTSTPAIAQGRAGLSGMPFTATGMRRLQR